MDNPYLPTKDSLVTEVTNRTILQLREEEGLRACGIGSGMMHQVRMLAISFDYYQEIDIDRARELLMKAGTVFLGRINENEKLRPFLLNYPFEPKNIQIAIFIYKPDGSSPDPNHLDVISMTNGLLRYKIDNPDGGLITICEEKFEDARAKLALIATR